VDVSGPAQGRDALVYIDRKRVAESRPRKEYVYRMNMGIRDAVKMGVPRGYVDAVMRKFIPDEGEGREKGEVERVAMKQALSFVDEN
jgi:gamma-glutamylcyclotransferase